MEDIEDVPSKSKRFADTTSGEYRVKGTVSPV
jgi:hypothetical protein